MPAENALLKGAPSNVKNNPFVNGLAIRAQNTAAQLRAARQAARQEAKGSPASVAMDAIPQAGGAFVAGFADRQWGDVWGVRPSTGIMIAAAAVGASTGSATAMQVATGIMCVKAYAVGVSASDRWAQVKPPAAPTEG